MSRGGVSDTAERLSDRMISELFPAELRASISALFKRWYESGAPDAPMRATIDPLSMPELLPDLAIMEFVAADIATGSDWRYVLVGERVREMIGGTVKGRMLSDVLSVDENPARVRKFYDVTRSLRFPTLTFGQHTVGYATQREFARLLFPYRDPDGEINTLLLLLIYL